MTDKIKNSTTQVYAYRWMVLTVFALLNAVIQIQWIALAIITSEAMTFYSVNAFSIGILSMIFMFLYIVMGVPASWMIDNFGLKKGIGFGAVLIGICSLLKGIFADSYTAVFITQVGLAIAQPFVLNAYTKLSMDWFPREERATATGIATLSQYIGIIIAMALTPFLYRNYQVDGMLLIYGVIAMIFSVLFLVLFRSKPPLPPDVDSGERYKVFDGVKHMMKQKNMILLLVLFFIGLGIFNAVVTWIEQILNPRGISIEQAGIIGAVMFVGGIAGAVIIPILSDRSGKRKPYLVFCMAMSIPGLAGLTFASHFGLLIISAFIFGFFIMSAGPIGFQYGAEITQPAPESTSLGLILMSGQISGILFIIAMDSFRLSASGSMMPFMVVFIVLTAVAAFLGVYLKDPENLRS